MYKNYAKLVLVAIAIITLLLLYFSKNLSFNYNFESFFPIDDPDLDYYLQFREDFENDNDYLLIGLVNQPSIFDSTFLSKCEALISQLDSLELTESATSILNIEKKVISPLGVFSIPVIHYQDPKSYKTDSVKIFKEKLFNGSLIAEDASSLLVMLKHKQKINKPEADKLVGQINRLVGKFDFQKVHIAGKAKAQGIYIDKMKKELFIFLSISILLVIAFLAITFRSLWGIVTPLLVVMLSIVWIIGLMGAFNKPLDILMVLLPTIMFVVGMSDVVHIMTKYVEELRNGCNKIKALKIAFREVGIATFLTSLTTAVGFFTLITASIKPIREFGLYTGIGVFVAYTVAFTLLPVVLLLTKKPQLVNQQKSNQKWKQVLGSAFILVLRNKATMIIAGSVLILLSFYGISKVQINTYLIEDIPNEDPLKQDFFFFDENFGGSRPFEMTVTVLDSNTNIYSPGVLKEMEKVEAYLQAEYGVGGITSPVPLVKSINQALNGGTVESFKLPDNEKGFRKVYKYIRGFEKGKSNPKVTTKDRKIARVSGRLNDDGSAITLEKTKKLYRFVNANIDTSLIELKLTGTSNLIDKNNEYLTENMLQGLGIAFLVIAVIAGIMFKSLRMVLITLIPNIIPLLMVAAIMGYFGISLKLSTSIVFTIAFGIAVDDTIHFISKLKLELQKGKSLLYALKRTFLSTGKAILITTAILSGGFLTLILSDFGGTFYTGLLVSLTLIFAVVIDLTLLPVLILMFIKRTNTASSR